MVADLLKIITLNCKVTALRMIEAVRVLLFYYRNLQFVWMDFLLAIQYSLRSPYRISKAFLKAQGADNIHAYGQTPLSVLDRVARECRLVSKDIVYDLGCGTGRTTLWLGSFVRCKAIGIDFLPTFVRKAQWVKRYGNAHRVTFRNEDMMKADMSDATAIYLYGTCLDDDSIERLIEKFKRLPARTKIVTVTYPLSDFSDAFTTTKQFYGRFPWGKTPIYLNKLCTETKNER